MVSVENARLLRKHICFISEDQHCKFGFCCMKYWSYIKICFVRRSSGIFLSLRKYLNILTWVLLLGSNQPISDLRPQRLAEWPTPKYASVFTAPSREFYWRYKRSPAANHHCPWQAGSAWLGGARPERLKLWRPRGNNLKHLYQEIWKEMLLGTDICFGFVKFVKYNYKSMLEKTAAKNALQREESKLIWRPKIKNGIPICTAIAP